MNWQDYIESVPGVMMGKPCIKGTRLSVEFILEQLGNGWRIEDLEKSYGLSAEQVRAAESFAVLRMTLEEAMNVARNFFSAYFHEDWDVEAADYQGVVCIYRADASSEECVRVADAIRQVAHSFDESQLPQLLLLDLGCYYYRKGAIRDWLLEVADELVARR